MINKEIRLFALLLLSLGLTELQAQNVLKVIDKTGTETLYGLSSIRKLTFPTGNLLVNKTDGTTQMYAINNLRLLNFSGMITHIEQAEFHENGGVLLYPNPVVNELTLVYQSNYTGSFNIDVVDLLGKVVFTKTMYQSEGKNQLNIDLSSLPKGFYVCRLIKGFTVETIKFIKN